MSAEKPTLAALGWGMLALESVGRIETLSIGKLVVDESAERKVQLIGGKF